jgi:hypothetical protein
MTATIDKGLLKIAIRELANEDPFLFKNIVQEVLRENINQDDEIDILVKKNFEKYAQTFNDLA